MKETALQKNVKRLCAKKFMELRDLAEFMDVNPSSLSRSLAGDPKLSTLKRIADVLDTSVQTLIEEDDIVEGWLMVNGEPHRVYSREEVCALCKEKEPINIELSLGD